MTTPKSMDNNLDESRENLVDPFFDVQEDVRFSPPTLHVSQPMGIAEKS